MPAALRAKGYVVHTPSDATIARGSLDVDLFPPLGEAGWVLLTKDKNIRRRQIELRALMRSRVAAFVLTSGDLKGEEQAHVFSEALPAMLRILRKNKPPFMARVTAEANVELLDLAKLITDEGSEK